MSEHVEEAKRVLGAMPTAGGTLGDAYAYARAHATLAVAEQLRIANLIALTVTIPDDRDGNGAAVDDIRDAAADRLVKWTTHTGARESYYTLRPEIARALGIEVSDE